MWDYYEYLSFKPIGDIEKLKKEVQDGSNPKDAKVALAQEIVARFHGDTAGNGAVEAFNKQFSGNQIPDDIPVTEIVVGEGLALANILKEAGLTNSTSDAHRMVKQGAVKIDGEKVADSRQLMSAGGPMVVQVGKRRFCEITLI